MGVRGLWRLLMPIGRRISIETLEGQILAIDASIWLTQFLKAMRDPDSGSIRPAAHLIGFLRRLAKLRFHRIRPVLVFDGATPIIKLREIAARRRRREALIGAGVSDANGNATGDSVQRLAKRLLVQQLKKGKQQIRLSNNNNKSKGTNRSAFVSTFRLPEEEADIHQDEVANGSDLKEEGVAGGLAPASMETSEEIARAIQEEEWINNGGEGQHAIDDDGGEKQGDTMKNDWDAPLPSEESNVARRKKRKRKRKRRQQRTRPSRGSTTFSMVAPGSDSDDNDEDDDEDYEDDDDSDFSDDNSDDAQQRASKIPNFYALDPHDRKDAIEAAKKRQRLRSRREFMPVAGQPEQYSQVQLRNFLRSSRLNLSIIKQGQDAVKHNAEVDGGEQIASDARRRIHFEKFDEVTRKRQKSQSKNRRLIRRRANSDSDSELDEWIEEDDEKQPTSSLTKSPSLSKRVIVDSDTDDQGEGEEEGSEDGGGGGGFLPSSAPPVLTYPASYSELLDGEKHNSDEDDEYGEGGGFLFPPDAMQEKKYPQPKHNRSTQVEETHIIEDEMLARAIQDSTIESAALRHNESHAVSILNEDRHSMDDTNSQDVEDAMVAQAVEASMKYPQTRNHESIKSTNPSTTNDKTETLDDDILDRKIPGRPAETVFDSDEQDEDDDVDWEDGEKAEVKPARTEVITFWEDEVEKDDEVEWEDGEDAGSAVITRNSRSGDSFSSKHVGALQIFNEDADDADEDEYDTSRLQNDFASSSAVDSNVAALQQAQETATRLTNWAGRAFKRALKTHAAETGNIDVVRNADHFSEQELHCSGGTSDIDENQEFDESKDKNNGVITETNTAGVGPITEDEVIDLQNVGKDQGDRDEVFLGSSPSASTKTRDSVGPTSISMDTLLQQEDLLNAEHRRQQRDMETVTDEMKTEILELIQLFGIPFVEAPAEAEAQCAALEQLGLVDGIVTEDSDVFVFGGKTVLKNIFDDQKFVEVYKASDAARELALGRNEMVALAMLLGGDYTDGVKGVGIVNGMEILQEFDMSKSTKEGLQEFRKWLDGFDPVDIVTGKVHQQDANDVTPSRKFHNKHRSARTRWNAPPNFPADNVLNAYLNPVVDKSEDQFSWGIPDLEGLVQFCDKYIGWESVETRRLLSPVLERLEETSRQTRLDAYFMKYDDNIQFANVRSKRLKAVFSGIHKKKSKSKSSTSPHFDKQTKEGK